MTWDEVAQFGVGGNYTATHPDMVPGYVIVFVKGRAAYRYPNGRLVPFKPGDLEAQRTDWTLEEDAA